MIGRGDDAARRTDGEEVEVIGGLSHGADGESCVASHKRYRTVRRTPYCTRVPTDDERQTPTVNCIVKNSRGASQLRSIPARSTVHWETSRASTVHGCQLGMQAQRQLCATRILEPHHERGGHRLCAFRLGGL